MRPIGFFSRRGALCALTIVSKPLVVSGRQEGLRPRDEDSAADLAVKVGTAPSGGPGVLVDSARDLGYEKLSVRYLLDPAREDDQHEWLLSGGFDDAHVVIDL
jgi:hypothetical protein